MSAHYLAAGGYLGCVPQIPITGDLQVIDARPSLDAVTCPDCFASEAARLAGYRETAPPAPELAPSACPFCRLLPPERRRPDHTAKSVHTIPVEIHAVPGATFRTTKREFTSGSEKPREARPTWKAPTDVGRAFRRALLAIVDVPLPTPEEVP